VADLLTFRFAGVLANVSGFLGAVTIFASELPAVRARSKLRFIITVAGAVCTLYWFVLYSTGFYYANSHLNALDSRVSVGRPSATGE
jgi:hypothetical protein